MLAWCGCARARVCVCELFVDTHCWCQISYYPQFQFDAPSEVELLFVVDRSASMAGAAMRDVRHILRLLVRQLPKTARFNILEFGSTFCSLFPTAMSANDANARLAFDRINRMQADFGASDVWTALKPVMRAGECRARDAPLRNVVLLTDGQVSKQPCIRVV